MIMNIKVINNWNNIESRNFLTGMNAKYLLFRFLN